MESLSISGLNGNNSVYFGCTKPINSVVPKIETEVSDTVSRSKKSFLTRFKKSLHASLGRHLTHFSKAEMQKLEKCPLEEFNTIASEICAKSYGIPQELRAQIVQAEMNPSISMAYVPSWNTILVNNSPRLKLKNRPTTYAMIKHEHLHQRQTIDILRTEEFGLEAIDGFAKERAESGVKNFINTVRNVSDSEIEKMLEGESPDIVRDVTIYRNAVKQGPKEEQECIDAYIKTNFEIAKKELMEIRKIAIEKIGLIKEGTPEANVSRELFQGIMSTQKGKETSFSTCMKRHEVEAYTATTVSFYEYLFCKIKNIFGL